MEGTSHGENRQVEPRGGAGDISTLVLFNRNAHFAYIFKKTEKLVTAVYMITNYVKDSEPLKWKIRENALELMALNIAFNTASLSERRDLIKEYQALSLEIVSLSSIACHSGLISDMNFQILSREFTQLLLTIEKDENKKASEETVILDPRFFEVAPKAPESPIGQPSQRETFSAPAPIPAKPASDVFYKGQESKDAKPAVEAKLTGEGDKMSFKELKEKQLKTIDSKDGRQAIILKLLSKKSGLSIKDFATNIKGCSEKTIQRELLSMVASGAIKKEGERRWSTYSLA